jgi:hypothetical protein
VTIAPTHVIVMAKSPIPGRVKTRLCPPCTPKQAAAVAEAALADTLETVTRCGADRFLLALDGPVGPWLPAGFEVFAQRGTGLAERLAAAWSVAAGRGIQIGMDTPQIRRADLDHALHVLDGAATDAVLGPAEDGGWWLIGLEEPDDEVFIGVPMSERGTGAAQLRRLQDLGRRTRLLAPLNDVDTFADAREVARLVEPASRFRRVVDGVRSGLPV